MTDFKAGLIAQLRDETCGLRSLGKVEKIFIDNTNIIPLWHFGLNY